VTEDAIPVDAVGSHHLSLRLLVAARDASRVALGRVHLGPPSVEVVGLLPGAVIRAACLLLAVRRHRSSVPSKLAFTPAYHVTTE
jgi:hypothetical protein